MRRHICQPKTRLPAQDLIAGVHVHRVSTTRFGRSNLVGRALDYVSFYISARRAMLSLVAHGDIVITMTDPPLICIVAMAVARRRGAHLINWLQDIYPEIAAALGIPLVKGPLLRGLSHLRDRCLKTARDNVVVGERMADTVASLGVPRPRIHIIPNWTEDQQIVPIAPEDSLLRRDWKLQRQFVVGYCGNLGRAHEFETILAAAERLRSNSNIIFLFVGGGHQLVKLIELVKERRLTNFRFLDYQDQSILKFSLCVPDVHWISLKPEVEGLIVPSKFYGIAAAGRPIVAICSKDGEIARLVEQYQCGFVVEPGQDQRLTETLLELSTNAGLRALLGRRARVMLESHFTRDFALKRWRAVVENIA